MEYKATNKPYSRYNTDHKKPFRQLHNMPLYIRQLVCTCQTIDITKWKWYDFRTWEPGMPNTDYHILICNSCRKPESYNLHKCTECEEIFIKDFYSSFCYEEPLCWNCTQDFPYRCRSALGTCIAVESVCWVAPVLPKPKVYAPGELEDFLNAYLE